jgi:hypothetical protein
MKCMRQSRYWQFELFGMSLKVDEMLRGTNQPVS